MTLRLTNSEMKDWRQCRRKWWLAYYRGLRRRGGNRPGSPLSFGSLVHKALEHYYETGGCPVEYVELTAEDEGERELAIIMLRGYVAWADDAGLRTLAVEEKVEVRLAPGINLLSKLDVVMERDDGAVLAREFKTLASIDPPEDLLKLDPQLLTEHLVLYLRDRKGHYPGILYTMLKKVKQTAAAKPPYYEQVLVEHPLEQLRSHWRHVLAYARQIEQARAELDAGADHHMSCPPSPTKDCTWQCDFYQVCRRFDDGTPGIEDALDALYEVGDPLERYKEAA